MLEHRARRLRRARIATDDEDGVVAGDGADHVGQLRAIDRNREQLRLPWPGLDHDELLRHVDARMNSPSDRDNATAAAAGEAGACASRRRLVGAVRRSA